MTGKIVVFVAIVSGPGSLAISYEEDSTITTEVIAGLDFWTNQAQCHASAGLSFVMIPGTAEITAPDITSCSSREACHNAFADPALEYFGFSTGQAGKDAAVQQFKDHENADGAYIAFFSKYRQDHFAYAYFGGGPSYMQYSNGGWGPDAIDRVFAHETGHVFNAPDEYTSCKCYSYYGKGTCKAINVNCTSSKEDCIMDANDFKVCLATKFHVGWC